MALQEDAGALQLSEFSGNAHQCGRGYGRRFAVSLAGFCQQEIAPDSKLLRYARRCWSHIEPLSCTASFMRGVADGSGLSLELITALALHEEITHLHRCTAFVANGKAPGTSVINAMNWDWPPALYGWSGVLRLRLRGRMSTLTYHFPGLWAAAGVNEAGMSVTWTSSAYFPNLEPVVGVPTYVLTAELLQCETVAQATAFLASVRHAGSLNLLLADASGERVVVELMPGEQAATRGQGAICRTNHFTIPKLVDQARQDLPLHASTILRLQRAERLLAEHPNGVSLSSAKRVLTDRRAKAHNVHQFPDRFIVSEHAYMTIDSIIAVPSECRLHLCRGGREPGRWQAFSLS